MTTSSTIIVLSANGDSALSGRLCDVPPETRELVDYKERLLFAKSMEPVFHQLDLDPVVPYNMGQEIARAQTGTAVTFMPDEDSTSLKTLLSDATQHGLNITPMYTLMSRSRAH